jgi:hypothetical protein
MSKESKDRWSHTPEDCKLIFPIITVSKSKNTDAVLYRTS